MFGFGSGVCKKFSVLMSKIGGGALKYLLLFPLLCVNYAFGVELSSLCSQTTGNSCNITKAENEITNNGNFNKNTNISIQTQITNFINYGDINIGTNTINVNGTGNTIVNVINYGRIVATSTGGNHQGASFASWSGGVFQNFYNYGYISGGITLDRDVKNRINITNYGIMAGVDISNTSPDDDRVTIDNYNLINLHPETKMHFADLNELVIKNYAIKIEQNSQNFNNSSFTLDKSQANNSHLYASETNSITFSDENSRLILSAGGDFEFGKDYLTNKLILSRKGNAQKVDENNIDASRLTTKDNYLELSTTPTHFKLNVNAAMSEVSLTHKANIKSINLMTLQSNDIIFEQNYQPVRQRKSTKRTRKPQRTDDFYFNFTPYAAYNELGEQNRYDLSGFEYGFIAAFSQKMWGESYGIHLGFGYGEYKDKGDDSHFKDFFIKNMNFMGGFHYKRDLLYDMYVKARLDGFYFMNEFGKVPYYHELGAKPNTFGAGGSVYLGQSFNFRQLGVLSLEAGLDYKALKQMKELKIIDEFQSKNEIYEANLYHLLYGDLALAYRKQLGYGLRFNAKLGARANALKNLAKGKLTIYDKSYDFTLDNDEFLGFGNVGLNYKMLEKLDLSLNYSGVLGDKTTSHAGNFAFKLWW